MFTSKTEDQPVFVGQLFHRTNSLSSDFKEEVRLQHLIGIISESVFVLLRATVCRCSYVFMVAYEVILLSYRPVNKARFIPTEKKKCLDFNKNKN